MNTINAQINRVNGRELGTCIFLNAETIQIMGVGDKDFVKLSVTAERGKVLLTMEP
jgi:hypothetical protein